nr:Ig-like domain-containing protein [Schumannella luteola]
MGTASPRRRRTRGIVIAALSSVAAAAVVATSIVVAQGYDAQHVNPLETGVWVYRDAGQYARVDTDLKQIDTVRDAEDPRGVLQDGAATVVLTDALRKRWAIDPSDPPALVSSSTSGGAAAGSGADAAAGDASADTAGADSGDADAGAGSGDAGSGDAGAGAGVATGGAADSAAQGQSTPPGTRQVVSSGAWSAYLTESGKVFIARVDAVGSGAEPAQIDPLVASAKAGTAAYVASAITVADDGAVIVYSAAEGAIRRYDATSASWSDKQEISSPPGADADLLLTAAGGHWALAAPASDRVWIDGARSPVSVSLGSDAVAGQASSSGDRAYFADSDGLVEVATGDRTARRLGDGGGTPAAPAVVDGVVYGAWISQSGGRIWSSDGVDRRLSVPDGALAQTRTIVPLIASNGRRAVLAETSTGLLWTIPDGTVIPLSQWTIDRDRTTQQAGTVEVPDVAEEEPPVAEPDSFGVRSGTHVLLPVLLNDHDPNKRDVLTIDPASVGGLADPGFGTLSLAAEDQQLVVDVRARSGSTTFTYAASDGQQSSQPTTVTLRVVPDGENSPPQWCGVEGCLQQWPSVSIEPGATTTVPVLDGWVDPDGDAMMLSAAAADDPDSSLTVVPTGDGRVAIRHRDPNAAPGTETVTVSVTDAQGATSTRQLTVVVAGGSALAAGSFAAVGRVGDPLTIDVAQHVRGGSGSYRLVDAVVADAQQDGIVVVPNAAAGTVSVTASRAGQFALTYTVQDASTDAEQTAQLRFSAVEGAGSIGVPPLTAFVRPQQDTTLDLLGSVQNTTGRVLTISSATTTDPNLAVSVIGGAQLRVSGATDDGLPGRVGTATVTVTDGVGTTATGQVAVFLTGATTGVAPIALPDAVTVRAGSLVDIPVTENDIAPRGEQLELSTQVQGSGAKDELVFASGQTLRYLAPAKAGSYTVRYSVSLAGDPRRTATAPVAITVVAAGTNHDPEPRALSARTLAGQSVDIPVPATGADPDGDATVLTQVEQPKAGQGTAAVSADGQSIRYTAPGGGVNGGQVAFSYTLSDGHGGTGSATVHVAVPEGRLSEVAPITYSDAVRAVRGATKPLTVLPLGNDSDPAGGALELISLVPDAPKGAADQEYDRLQGLIDDGTDLDKGTVKLLAGDVEGVHSYIYTARSKLTSSTTEGLIVVTVAPSAVAVPPTITDTVVTVANRASLATGIDVVTGKTEWSSGELDSLKLTVWGEAAKRYTVDGWRISGPAAAGGALVPFQLAGTDATGADVVGYGMLRIPALDDMRLQLKASAQPIKVGEEATANARLADLIDLGSGDRLEQKGGSYAAQRANATCKSAGAGDIGYDAGREAPWTDSCTVLVRVAGQESWTAVPVPVVITSKAPRAILDPLSRTVAPGATQTIDLYKEVTRWEGGRVGDQSKLDYRVAYSGSGFETSLSGRTLSVTAKAGAHSGSRDSVQVSVTGFGGLSSAITLVVGIAPVDAPRPVTFTKSCSVGQGPSCTIPVIGIAGEYDPFAGKSGSGLKLVGIGQTTCEPATISTNGTSGITATWPRTAKPAGGSCIVPYSVADAQGRMGSANLTIDVQGYPAAPSSLMTSEFTGSSTTLLVDLGEAATAHPGVTGIAIYEGGVRVDASCRPGSAGTWVCVISGLQNGQRHKYTARAVNGVGESVDTSAVESWAYQAPTITNATAKSIYLQGRTDERNGYATLDITATADTDSFLVSTDGFNPRRVNSNRGSASEQYQLSPGDHSFSITPVSRFQPPLGGDGSGSSTTVRVTVGGTTYVRDRGRLKAMSNTSAQYEGVQFDKNYSDRNADVVYAIWKGRDGAGPGCYMGSDGGPSMNGSQASNIFTGLEETQDYSIKACAANGYGAAESVVRGLVWTATPAPAATSYTVQTTPAYTAKDGFQASATYGPGAMPSVSASFPYNAYYRYDGDFDRTIFELSDERAPRDPAVRLCTSLNLACSAGTPITAATAPTTATLRVDTACIADPKDTDIVPTRAVNGNYTVAVAKDAAAKRATYTITFTGAWSSLKPATLTRCWEPPVTTPPTDPGTGTPPGTPGTPGTGG